MFSDTNSFMIRIIERKFVIKIIYLLNIIEKEGAWHLFSGGIVIHLYNSMIYVSARRKTKFITQKVLYNIP